MGTKSIFACPVVDTWACTCDDAGGVAACMDRGQEHVPRVPSFESDADTSNHFPPDPIVAGVGKTSILHMLCNGEELRRPRSTVGCSIHTKVHESRAVPGKVACIVEFWDIGGSPRFEGSRGVFFQNVFDGLILVHDLTNSVSRRFPHGPPPPPLLRFSPHVTLRSHSTQTPQPRPRMMRASAPK